MVFSPEELATEIELDGRLLRLNTDWRDIMRIIAILSDNGIPPHRRADACLCIFIDNVEDVVDGQKAISALYNFIDCGEKPSNTKGMPKEMDWKADFPAIISDMNKVAKCEDIRALPYMHWFTFVSIYHAIGEGNLSYRVNIRRKLRKGEKLSPDEAEWVGRNPDKAFLQKQRGVEDDNEDDL